MPSPAELKKWLNMPDGPDLASVSHNNAREKHLEGSGQWLLEDEKYIKWKGQSNSFMWLNGICEWHNNKHWLHLKYNW